jgi:hypothetical protein
MDSCCQQQITKLKKKDFLVARVLEVRLVDDFVMCLPNSNTMWMQTPNILQAECRRCEMEKISPITGRRAEDERLLVGYSGCCVQRSPNLAERYRHSSSWRSHLLSDCALADGTWAG